MRMRRDPRAEREARRQPGGARPRFSLGPVRPEAGRMRRDPRVLRQAATVSSAPRLRIAWKGGIAPYVGSAAIAERAPAEAVRIVSDPAFLVLVVADMAEGGLGEIDRQVIAAGRLLADPGGGAVCVLATGEGDFGSAGADRTIAVAGLDPPGYDPGGPGRGHTGCHRRAFAPACAFRRDARWPRQSPAGWPRGWASACLRASRRWSRERMGRCGRSGGRRGQALRSP